jgi:hypothetical protein
LGQQPPLPWDPDSAITMAKAGRSVTEERLIAALLADLQR